MGKRSQKTTAPTPNRSKRAKRRTWIAVGILMAIILIGYLVSRIPGIGSTYGEGDPVKGAPQAKVRIVEYSDFQCPACQYAQGALKQIVEEYGETVQIIFNDFPLVSNHPNALPAAEAAQCAYSQQRFWEYHDLLFEGQNIWAQTTDPRPHFLDYARETGLNIEQFSRCIENHETQKAVRVDMKEGEALRIRSTPTFFINDTRLVGPATFNNFKEAIDAQPGRGNKEE
ncbi:MAG: DsbA family protein [Nitrospirota bacterium]|nr:DsbA family protein [Nitrospirota bacterium]